MAPVPIGAGPGPPGAQTGWDLSEAKCLSYNRAMKLTPLDIRQRRFESSFRGLAHREVQDFLEVIANDFEELMKESIGLKEDLQHQQSQLNYYREREKALQETLIAAQKMSQDLKAAAKKEAEIIVTSAEHQAEKIVQSAHQKLVQVVEDINELKRQRVQFESQLRGLVDGHSKLLEMFRQSTFADSDWERIEDNVTFLAPKKLSGAS
jgi:cell division initiation protein